MKMNSLTTAVIAGIAGVAGIASMANAVNLNPDGLGQVLIYPYYTVRGGNGTLLSVINTHDEGKAVKVRFLEGYNSREVLDFNLYLSPFDVWVAQVYDNGAGGAVATNDNSCTVPTFTQTIGTNKAQPFSNFGYTQGAPYTKGAFQGQDSGPTGLDRTREGYVEMIEMGVVTNATKGSLTAITHIAGVPKSCAQVNQAWAGGYWFSQPLTDMTTPSGGLFGAGSVLNVGRGTIAAYDADAIDGFSQTILHTNPGSITPNLASANFGGGGATSYVFNNGQLVTSSWPTVEAIDAVSSVFMADNVFNEYLTDPSVGAASEWVVTFPTKRFYVDPAIVGTSTNSFINPFQELFGGGGSGSNDPGVSCFAIGLSYTDREEAQQTLTNGFSPPPIQGGTSLCYEAQVITFNQSTVQPGVVASSILASQLASNVQTSYNAGWLDLAFNSTAGVHHGEFLRDSTEGNLFAGLPVTGFLVTNLVNNGVTSGVLANYAGLYRHRISRNITSD